MPRSRVGIASAIALSVSWSSAFRESGRLSVSRATASAGSSSRSFPPASSSGFIRGRFLRFASGSPRLRLFEDDQDVALGNGLALLDADLGNLAGVLGLDGHLHLHRLEDGHGVALADLVADRDLDLPDRPGDVSLYVRHARRGQYPAVMRESTAGRVVIVAARNEAETIGATLDGLAQALP